MSRLPLFLTAALCLLPCARELRAQEPDHEEIRRALQALQADTLGERAADTTRAAAADTLTGSIPSPDHLYNRLLEGATVDTLRPSEGPIVFRGLRLVFYPETEVIVLEGEAAAEQGGTSLEADRILYRSGEGIVEAFGDATVSQGPSALAADSMFYDQQTGVVATFGVSLLREGQSQTEGMDLRYDLKRRSGVLGGGVTTYAPWVLVGDEMSKIGESTFLVNEGHFTTCELPDPHYRFVSEEIKLRRDDVIVASPIVLYFSDVPVFFLPWYVEPVTRGRHSGFLRPKIGINTLLFGSGRERNVQDLGYYYVFGDYGDATLAADWYTESRFIIRLDGRYHLRYNFQGGLDIEQVWNRLDESSSRFVRFRHDHTLSRDTRASADVNWSNTRSFLRRNSFDPEEILQRSFRSAANYTTRFGWGALVAGSDADFRLDVNRTDFRLADVRLSLNQRPLWGRSSPVPGEAADRPWWQALQHSANGQVVARLSRAEVDSLGQPLTRIRIDSLTGRPIEGETETIVNQQDARFQYTLSGPLNLFGIFNTTPSLSYSATVRNDEMAEGEKLGGQGDLNAGLNLSTRFFRIFRRPVGPFMAMRHTVAPALNVTYAPSPSFWGAATEGTRDINDQLFANLSLTQDVDVKLPVREDTPSEEGGEGAEEAGLGPSGAAAAEAARADSLQVPAREGDREGRQEVPTRTVNLLNITNSLGFDVMRHREADKLGFRDLTTRISSGLGQSFHVSTSFTHSLVKVSADSFQRESFSPFLSSITTDFSISRGGGAVLSRRRDIEREEVLAGRGDEEEIEERREGLGADEAEDAGFGPWSLDLTHSWSRTREGIGNHQSLGIGARLLPSPAWSLSYNTNYDITESKFQGQTLSLIRELHDWTASLNVNFFPSEPQDRVLVTFSVYLTEAPDLQVPYRVRRE